MAVPSFMSVEGFTQGLITAGAGTEESIGNMAIEDHPDECRIIEINHNIFIPKDPHSGQPTGQRIHEALIITKMMDKSSPLFYNALATAETLKEVIFKFYRTSAAGSLEHYATWLLEQGICVGIKATMPNILDPALQQYGQLEKISFSYAKISWTHEIAGTAAEDSFRRADI